MPSCSQAKSASPAGTMPVQPKNFNRRDQRAVCCAARAARRSVCLLDDARSTSQTARSSRACMVQGRKSGGLPSAARRRALRSGFVPLNAPLRLRSTSPLADRRPKLRTDREMVYFVVSENVTATPATFVEAGIARRVSKLNLTEILVGDVQDTTASSPTGTRYTLPGYPSFSPAWRK